MYETILAREIQLTKTDNACNMMVSCDTLNFHPESHPRAPPYLLLYCF